MISAKHFEDSDSNIALDKNEPANQAPESDTQYSQKTFCEDGSLSRPLSDQNESDKETAQAVKSTSVSK